MAKRKKQSFKAAFLVFIVAIFGGGFGFFKLETSGTAPGSTQTIIYLKPKGIGSVLADLETKGIIKNVFAAKVLAVLKGSKKIIDPGVYNLAPGMSASDVLDTLKTPIKQMVYIHEGRWIARVAKTLEDKKVCKAEEYIELAAQASKFKDMGLPFFNESLEGFLYPDTYNFAPGIGAEYVIRRQLMNFEKRTKDVGLTTDNARRTLIIASLLELEAADYQEKQMIAGVIENRLIKGMRLQLDATVNYGMQLWRPLVYSDYKAVKSPYNTYLYKGLPPGPICSPTADSIRAARNPIKHNMLYYIYFDHKTHFAATYAEHLKNVKLRDTMKAAQPKR